MINTTSSNLRDALMSLRANPGKVQQTVLNLLERLNGGSEFIIDPTNPAIFALESASVLSSANMIDSESKLRRQYPSMAQTREELYLHMSDKDFNGVFSNGGRANISFMFDLQEIKQKAVYEAGTSGTRRLTIPRFTRVTVGDVPLVLLNPVDIRVMSHGGFVVTLDTRDPHPLMHVDNNLLEQIYENRDGVEYLHITVPMYQLDITRNKAQVSATTGFSKEIPFPDNYCNCLAYIMDDNGKWTRIKTAHTDYVFNKDTPTVQLRVYNGTLRVNIPQMYFNAGLIKDMVRLDVYSTKGPIDIDLQNYNVDSYTLNIAPLDRDQIDSFSAPLETLNTLGVYCRGSVTGGTIAMGFEELKRTVTERSTIKEGYPISEKQLVRSVKNLGYSLVKTIDHVTDRQFVATRFLPMPASEFISSTMGVTTGTLETSILKLKELETVNESTYRVTIKPDTLYLIKDGKLELVTNESTKSLYRKAQNDLTTLVNQLNTNTVMYSPFYYVLDVENNEIVSRIYDLDSPTIRSRVFVQSNASLGLNLGIKDYSIVNSPDKDGYLLEVELDIGEKVKSLGPDYLSIQLSYVGRGVKNRYYIAGELVTPLDDNGKPLDNRYIYRFKIETKYDIDKEDGLMPIPFKSPINLIHEFDVVCCIRDYNPDNSVDMSDIDKIVSPKEFIDYNANHKWIGASQYKVNIEFGRRLNRIWQKTRTLVDAKQIEFYEEDVPAVYTENVYLKDKYGNVKLTYNAKENVVKSTILHRTGDPIIGTDGQPVMLHRKGEPKLDGKGKPLYKDNGDGLVRQIDIFLVDAMFKFGNTHDVITYRDHCVRLLSEWIHKDMNHIHMQLLDRSEIFFHPSSNIGNVRAIADNNRDVTVNSKQKLKVTCFISDLDFQNVLLRDALEKDVIKTIQKVLQNKNISRDGILQALRQKSGNTVKSFVVDGFTRDKYKTITLQDDTVALTIATKVVILPNMQLDLQDDIEVEFLIHDSELNN